MVEEECEENVGGRSNRVQGAGRSRLAGSGRLIEAVAHAVDRRDAVALWFDRLDLLAQVLDVAIDGEVADIALVGMQTVQQLGARTHGRDG